jgi:hypothetical protein
VKHHPKKLQPKFSSKNAVSARGVRFYGNHQIINAI